MVVVQATSWVRRSGPETPLAADLLASLIDPVGVTTREIVGTDTT